MRCLHCGSTLSAFKKLTDSDFCSTEHKDHFYTEQQQLIRERLKYSRTRLHRLGRPGSGDSRVAAPVIAPVMEAQAPAKIAAFLSGLPGLHDRSLCLQFLPQIDPELSAANPPVRQEPLRVRRLLLPLISDFPWPRYNSGFLDSRSFKWARMARPKPAICFGPVRLCITAKHRALPGFGYRSFVELVPVEQPLSQKILQASPVDLVSSLAISESLRTRSEQRPFGLGFLDRAFKMRPRTGVLPVDMPLLWQITSEPLSSTVNMIRPSDLGVAAHSQLARVDRFLRFRPCGPLDSQTLTQFVPPVASEKTETRPGIPDLPIKQREFSPTVPARPFRMNLQAATGRSAKAIAANFALDFATGPVNPGFSSTSDCAPSLADRFYRPRPRGPVLDEALLALHRLNPEENGFVSQPAICELDNPVLTFQPGLSDRMFRMRPRSGVAGESVADLIPSTTPEGLVSPPATPSLAGLTDASPSLVTRMYRMRPGCGLNSAATAIQLQSLTTTMSAGAADLAIAKFYPALPNLSPAFQDRAFRMRPRAGVSSDRTQSAESITAAPAQTDLAPSVIGFVSSRAGDFAPPLFDQLYRGKPKTAVPSAAMAAFTFDGATAEQFVSKPAVRSIGAGDCWPNLVLRLYRFRPKSAVDGETPLASFGIAPLDFVPSQPEFVPDWWDVISGPKPIFVNRMYRMRLKQPAQDADTMAQPIRTRHLAAPDPEPVLATMPAPSGSAAAPSFLDRLYRMRPKSGKAAAPATNAIACNPLEPRPHSGAPAAILRSVSKHWKSTPLSIKSIAAIVPLLLLMVFIPWDVVSKAGGDSILRQAIARRAAIEQGDDFGEGLRNWQGIDNWKRMPSGAMEPVGLGLFKPSLELRDYRVAFSAQIVKQALGFVVRAMDSRNYQAIKLVTLKPGPLPTVAVVRYAVINGKETDRKQTILPMTVAADTVYRIALDVNDQSFTLMVQGKVVDFWSEERLKIGGAGFFSAKGERALIQNIRISHHDDAIGRLFAALALNVQASDGSERRR